MPDNFVSILFAVLFFGLWAVAMGRLLWKSIKAKFSRPKSAPAEIVHKQTVESFSKYAGNGTQTKYVVVFSLNGKKKSFYVSQFSYNGYRIGEKGTLTYQGDRLIRFQS